MNSLLSLGRDRHWRREAAAALDLTPGARVLDVATGTGALATEVLRAAPGALSVTGCDLNERMLAVAHQRAAKAGLALTLVRCDATRLPFSDGAFDAVTIGFAIDDMADREACALEMRRVLKPGGRLVLLELGQPDAAVLRALYRGYLRVFRVAGDGHRHLEQEIRGYKGANAIAELLARTGFVNYTRRSLTGGIARLHTADRAPGARGGAS
jgi:demethylmenaquinone methyltransferase/2-methoxy-6-polyprenyl-1,4-benzoquinol methylase